MYIVQTKQYLKMNGHQCPLDNIFAETALSEHSKERQHWVLKIFRFNEN